MDRYTLTIRALMGALILAESGLERRVLHLLPLLVEQRARHWTKGAHGYFTGSYSDGSGAGLDKSGGSGIIRLPDEDIGHSVSAKAKNYDVMDLATGEKYLFVEGTNIQNVEVFAGKGVRTPYMRAEKYAQKYGGKAKDWQHVKGTGYLSTSDGERHAEVHWSQCENIGKVEFFVKRWLDE